MDRSELYGKYSILENYLDEYFEAKLLNSNRIEIIENSIFELIKKDFSEITLMNKNNQIEEIDSYLCKIKNLKLGQVCIFLAIGRITLMK